jgi:diguanylate cyclase (GGDEF)-like protein/PAS domain S-box-containing protein
MNLNSRDDAINNMNPRPLRTALKIAIGYAVVGWIWILTSDRIVAMMTQDPATMVVLNSAKGSAFILVTATILLVLVYSQLQQVQRAQNLYMAGVQELESAHEELLASDEELRQQFDELTTQSILLDAKDKELWALFENMHDAFALHEIICDEQGKPVDYKFVVVNPAYERMIGMRSDQLLGRRALEVFPEIGERWIALCGEVALRGVRQSIRQYSKVIDRHLSMSLYSPATGRFAILAMDITDEQQHAQTVERLAYYDALTGLPNRAHLSKVLRREMEEQAADFCCGALLYLDMDDLKLVNDSYGHSYGDAILITAAMHMVSLAEPGSLVARVGGDEFIIWIPGAREQQPIETFARELVDTLSREYEVRELAFHSSASIGIAIYPEHGRNAEEILKNADAALYEAKRNGKRCWRFFEQSLQDTAYEQMQLLNGLRNAIANEELMVHYQPQITISEMRIVAFEALLRWKSDKHGNVSPALFIPLAEKSHLINEIGAWVLQESCRFCRRLINAGYASIRVAVNVSPRQLAAVDFIEVVQSAINSASIDPNHLEIEITESVFIETMDDSVEKLMLLKNLGVHVTLDDFGTGYSSLTYLRNLPVDTLKIDKSFIDRIAEDATQASLIASIIEMSHVLGLTVVAEGVETNEQLQQLRECRCDMFQGYIASRPLPEPEAVTLLRSV